MKKQRIIKYAQNGDFIEIFDSIKDACDNVGVKSHSGIIACCRMKPSANMTKGFQWRYYIVNYPLKISPAIKMGSTFKKKYGIGSENHDVLNIKREQTSVLKYGVKHPMQNNKVKETYIKSVFSLYGTDNPAKNKGVKDKISKTERERKTKKYVSEYLPVNRFKLISINDEDILEISSHKCGHIFKINRQLLTIRSRNKHNICTICNDPKSNQVSEIENYLYDKIKELDVEVNRNIVGLLESKKELDIYFPDYSFGIEVNGIKYHSEEFGKNEFYHLSKTEDFKDIGIDVYHFFDDEIINKFDIIYSMIKNRLGKSNVIYARKCNIVDLTNKEALDFMHINHIQGKVNSKFSYGLVYNNELVSIMTFGELRKTIGYNKKDNEFELLRYCNKLGTSVIGGASRLLKKFIIENSPKRIITYANRRWSNGNLYDKLGFSFIEFTKPGYYFFYKNKRVNRYSLRRSELLKMGFNKEMSTENMLNEIKAYKIWDCGNYKYELICDIYK